MLLYRITKERYLDVYTGHGAATKMALAGIDLEALSYILLYPQP